MSGHHLGQKILNKMGMGDSQDNAQQGQGHYGQSQSGQGQYGQSQYGQGQYGQSQYGSSQPSYGQYGQGQYGGSQPSHGQYGQSQYGGSQTSHGQYGQGQYGGSQLSQYGQGQYGQSQYGGNQSSHGQYGQGQYGGSQYGQGQSSHGQYGMGQYGGSQPSQGQHNQGQSNQGSSGPHQRGKRTVNNDERVLCTHGKGTYPRLCRLSDGSILSSFTRRDGNDRVLQIARSTDNGKSFHDIGEVSRGAGDVDNTYLLEVAPNTILAAFRNHDIAPGRGPTHFRITVCGSSDGGKSWRFLSQAAEKGAPLGLWEPFMRKGRKGEVQLTYSQEFAHDNQNTMRVISTDQGKSWSKPECIEGAKEKLRDGMNGIAETKDNGRDALVMVVETTRYRTFNLEAAVSYDDGATWQHRHEVYVPKRGHNAGSPQIASWPDGSLAIIFMTDEDSPKVEWTKHAATKAVFSEAPKNGKLNWSQPSTICPHASSWPGIMPLDHHNLLCTYDCGGPKGKTISWHP